ncbi:MAG: tetratricopeptide repeat protein [Saprospiraceae bacterium]|nr:tetratricopeptide repeat protein [Saprospiraceae bacterium]
MTKMQLAVIGVGLALVLVLYFVFDTKPKAQKALEKSRALAAESTSIDALLPEAKSALSPAQSAEILALEQNLSKVSLDTQKVALLKQLSGRWYAFGNPAIAGGYAEQVATLINADSAWSIAGTTYAICLQATADQKVRNFCTERAISAFENAISLNPENVAHRVNLALCYAENPPQNEPMKGPQMLLELNQQHPNNVLILNSLARLAIKTGQYDRAKERLEQAYAQAPQNINTICLLAQVYNAIGDTQKAEEFGQKCEIASNQ